MTNHDDEPRFKTFLIGGFESAAPIVEGGRIIDLLAASRHDRFCRTDYQLIKSQLGIRTVREGFSWHHINQEPHSYDFSRFEPMLEAGRDEQMEQIWSLCHFNYPKHLDILSEEAIPMFIEYAIRCYQKIRQYYPHGPLTIIPINEISFWSYMGGNAAQWPPFQVTKAYVMRRQLCQMAIAAMNKIWEEDASVRFIHTDPLFRRIPGVPPTRGTELIAELFSEIKFQPYDMLSGRLDPSIGGNAKFLDMIGGNYYPTNQEWVVHPDWLDDTVRKTIPCQTQTGYPSLIFCRRYTSATSAPFSLPKQVRRVTSASTGSELYFPKSTKLLKAAYPLLVSASFRSSIDTSGIPIYPSRDRACGISAKTIRCVNVFRSSQL